MKTMITIMAVLAAAAGYAQSPTTNVGQDVATVNIILRETQSVVVKPGDDQIDLIYDSKEAYENGVSVTKPAHLQVFSTQDYELQSAVWQENLITQNDIYVNDVLQTRQFQSFYQGSRGSIDLDIEYKAKGSNEYLDKNKTTYSTQVIYTIQPR